MIFCFVLFFVVTFFNIFMTNDAHNDTNYDLTIWIHGSEQYEFLQNKVDSVKHKLSSSYEDIFNALKSEHVGKSVSYTCQTNLGKYVFFKEHSDASYCTFSWMDRKGNRGPLSSSARQQAGSVLYEILCRYCADYKVPQDKIALNILASSHGAGPACHFIEEIKKKNNKKLKIQTLFFFESPKGPDRERAICLKDSLGKYIVERCFDVNLLSKKDIVQVLDFSYVFPFPFRRFLVSRDNLFSILLQENKPSYDQFRSLSHGIFCYPPFISFIAKELLKKDFILDSKKHSIVAMQYKNKECVLTKIGEKNKKKSLLQLIVYKILNFWR